MTPGSSFTRPSSFRPWAAVRAGSLRGERGRPRRGAALIFLCWGLGGHPRAQSWEEFVLLWLFGRVIVKDLRIPAILRRVLLCAAVAGGSRLFCCFPGARDCAVEPRSVAREFRIASARVAPHGPSGGMDS
jgi:hypothetical protein